MLRSTSQMKLTGAHYQQIDQCLPTQRGNVSLSSLAGAQCESVRSRARLQVEILAVDRGQRQRHAHLMRQRPMERPVPIRGRPTGRRGHDRISALLHHGQRSAAARWSAAAVGTLSGRRIRRAAFFLRAGGVVGAPRQAPAGAESSVRGGHGVAITMCRYLGPCAPNTRLPSMSVVPLAPVMMFTLRGARSPAAAAA